MRVFEERIEALKKNGKKAGIDALLVTSEKNMSARNCIDVVFLQARPKIGNVLKSWTNSRMTVALTKSLLGEWKNMFAQASTES